MSTMFARTGSALTAEGTLLVEGFIDCNELRSIQHCSDAKHRISGVENRTLTCMAQ